MSALVEVWAPVAGRVDLVLPGGDEPMTAAE